jgi:hypothetical protein
MILSRPVAILGFGILAAGCADDGTAPPLGGSLGLIKVVPVVENYGIHDTFVRDGLAFVLAWNTGVLIYDVGNGVRGGTPGNPVLISTTPTNGGQAHNAWWFHNPNTSEKRYLFVGEEGPSAFGSTSSGDIHVLDVSNLASPVEVAFYSRAGAGTHNFWMDEAGQILYAAYYNAGVVTLDVSGELQGNLATRELGSVQPGGPGNTYTWGVQLANGALYAIDMFSGLWRLAPGAPFTPISGGNNVPERYSSDLWVRGSYAYTGTWGARTLSGNALKVWRVDSGPAPVLVDSLILANSGTVSDVQVSDDGRLLVFSAEGGGGGGVYAYSLTDPARPALLGFHPITTGVHTVTLSVINGRLYAFGAKNPGGAALLIFDLTELRP